MIDLTITGIPESQEVLDELGGIEFLSDPMEESLSLLHDGMAQYPVQRPTWYIRRGNLGRTWTSRINISGNNITGVLGNNARDKKGRTYGPYVQADPSGPEPNQARVHQNWWQTDKQVMDDNESEIRQRFDRRLQSAANGEG